MVHTFELSKVISEKTFEILIKSLKYNRYNKTAWYTKAYADKGIPMVCLYKFKPKRKNENGKWIDSESELYMYMVILSINTGVMLGGDGYTIW